MRLKTVVGFADDDHDDESGVAILYTEGLTASFTVRLPNSKKKEALDRATERLRRRYARCKTLSYYFRR